MGLKFRKSIKIAPGVRLNLSKSGIGVSAGVKGFRVNSKGRATASIPGTGVSYSKSLSGNRSGSSSTKSDDRLAEAIALITEIRDRYNKAWFEYFASHGICISPADIEKISERVEYKALYDDVQKKLEPITRVARLFEDTGKLTAASKESAFKALYKIEDSLSNASGEDKAFAGIIREWASLNNAHITPVKTYWWAFLFIATMGIAGLGESSKDPASAGVGVFFLIFAGAGYYFRLKHKKTKTQELETVLAENKRILEDEFNAHIKEEVTPRASMPII